MQQWIKNNYMWLIMVVLAILLFISVRTCESNKNKLNEKDNLITSLNDTIRVWKDSEGSHGETTPIRTEDPDDFINAPTNNAQIKALQELVDKYKKELANQGVAGVYTGETKYDTIWLTKLDGRTIDTISNKWITSRFGFEDGKTLFNLKVRDSISFIIGEERQGLFKPKKPFARITNYNPYSEVKEFRTYQVTLPKKSILIKPGLYGGYGGTIIDGVVKTGFQIGGGIIITY